MLGKIIKHDWKSIYKMGGILTLVLAVVTLLGCLSFRTPLWMSILQDRATDGVSIIDMAGIFMFLLYIFALMGIAIAAMIYICVNFYRSMYTEQGYLTHTLPVSSDQLLFGKVLVGGIWYIIVGGLIILSVFAVIYSILSILLPVGFMDALSENWGMFLEAYKNMTGMSFGSNVIYLIISFIVSSFAAVMTWFGAITLGQLSAKHKVLMSIVSYLCIWVVEWIISYLVLIPTLFSQSTISISGQVVSQSGSLSGTWITLVINSAIAIGLYFLSRYIITHKLNLE